MSRAAERGGRELIGPGGSRNVEYRAWVNMKFRCLSPKCEFYDRYGGRGIRVYEPWLTDFEAFFEHVGPRPTPRHSLDRIDNAGHYEPGNVRWATYEEQNRNRRISKLTAEDVVRIRALLGEGLTQKDIGKMFGVDGSHISRIKTGAYWADTTAPVGAQPEV